MKPFFKFVYKSVKIHENNLLNLRCWLTDFHIAQSTAEFRVVFFHHDFDRLYTNLDGVTRVIVLFFYTTRRTLAERPFF